MNNAPISFVDSGTFRAERKEANQVLHDALNSATQRGNSRDKVDCLCNLGCFYYTGGDLESADRNFAEAIRLARHDSLPGSAALARLLDYDALVGRALNDFKRAETLYTEALQIRSRVYGFHNAESAVNLMNLMCLYRDWLSETKNPVQRKILEDRATNLEHQADALMNPRPSHDDNEIVFISSDISHTIPRSFHPCLTVNHGAGKLKDMVIFARSIIEKYDSKTVIGKPITEPGLATFVGTWTVPTDITTQAKIDTPKTSQDTLEGVEEKSGQAHQESRVADVEIFLCPERSYNALLQSFASFARNRGLNDQDLGKGWPANHQQALELLKQAKDAARALSFASTKTDTNGDYSLGRAPKGKYFLYAALVTQEQAAVWILPKNSKFIEVSVIHQFNYNFDQADAWVLWEKHRWTKH